VEGLGLLLMDDGIGGCLLVIVAVAISLSSSPVDLNQTNTDERYGSVCRDVGVVMEDSSRRELEVGFDCRSFDDS
jgi:hypothetical protein